MAKGLPMRELSEKPSVQSHSPHYQTLLRVSPRENQHSDQGDDPLGEKIHANRPGFVMNCKFLIPATGVPGSHREPEFCAAGTQESAILGNNGDSRNK